MRPGSQVCPKLSELSHRGRAFERLAAWVACNAHLNSKRRSRTPVRPPRLVLVHALGGESERMGDDDRDALGLAWQAHFSYVKRQFR